MQTLAPHRFERRILLAVTGLSPQVVTETLYALATCGSDPFIPTEVRLLTTAQGAERARLSLLHPDSGWFQRLCADYGLRGMRFTAADIAVLRDEAGRLLEDIRTPADNRRAGDRLTAVVRELTADPDSALHVSIAGGRKTMGFYAGYALSLFGRPQDRLSHVLVSPAFESHPDFYYPTPYSRVIHTFPPDSRPLDTRDAEVSLAEIPFVRLREGLPARLLGGEEDFSETVAAAQRALEPPALMVDIAHRRITAGGETVELKPAELAFYAWMARRRKAARDPVHWRDPDIAKGYLAEYGAIVGPHSGDYERAEQALKNQILKDWFEQRKSRTNTALKKALGGQLARPYLITGTGKRPETRFGLTLPVESIRFG